MRSGGCQSADVDGRVHLDWPEDLGPRRERPSVSAMRRVIGTFKAASGSSFDSIRPREFNLMGDLGIEALIDLVMAVEQAADWLSFVTNLAFIPKTDGGLRPIA